MANRNISQIHSFIDLISRKQRGEFFPSADKDAALDAGQKELFKECYNTKEFDALRPFKMNNVALNTDGAGLLNYPADFEYYISSFAGTLAAPIEIRSVDETQLPKAIKSQLRPVSTSKPIVVDGGRSAQVYPAATYAIKLTYYRTPSSPHFNYSQSGRVVTYDSTGSTQIEFSEIFTDRIIAKALGYLGIGMSEQEVVEFGKIKEQTA